MPAAFRPTCYQGKAGEELPESYEANLVAGMAWLQSTYTIWPNSRHKLTGHVLSGRYKARLVEGSSLYSD